jgi:hypothetical protein
MVAPAQGVASVSCVRHHICDPYASFQYTLQDSNIAELNEWRCSSDTWISPRHPRDAAALQGAGWRPAAAAELSTKMKGAGGFSPRQAENTRFLGPNSGAPSKLG